MVTGLIVFHVIVCVLLIVIVLLQFGKGAEAGAMMGSGASQNIFTSSSRGNFFTKLTTVLAVLFMVNSIALTIVKSKDANKSVFDDEAPQAMPLNTDHLDKEMEKAENGAAATNETANPSAEKKSEKPSSTKKEETPTKTESKK